MPRYKVVGLEKFVVRTVYEEVDAPNPQAAQKLCEHGKVAYDSHTIEEGDEEWLETVSVEEVPEVTGLVSPPKTFRRE